MRLALLTLTADRPEAFALCERWMRAQTAWSSVFDWYVIETGNEAVETTCDQMSGHVSGNGSPFRDFLTALWQGLKLCAVGTERGKADAVAFVEDDDYYPPAYLAAMLALLKSHDIAGARGSPYWHARNRVWRAVEATHCALAFTVIRAEHIPLLIAHIEWQLSRETPSPYVDKWLWSQAKGPWKGAVVNDLPCVAVKGMPGTPGIGKWHTNQFDSHPDPQGEWLRERIGADAEAYLGLEFPE